MTDGNLDTVFANRGSDKGSWLAIDLGQGFLISELVLSERDTWKARAGELDVSTKYYLFINVRNIFQYIHS